MGGPVFRGNPFEVATEEVATSPDRVATEVATSDDTYS
jgi:hypothetical protein